MMTGNFLRCVVATKPYLTPTKGNPTSAKYNGVYGYCRRTQTSITAISPSSIRGYTTARKAQIDADTIAHLKPYKNIPRAGLPFIGNLPYIIRHGFGSMHLNEMEMYQKYGSMYRIQLGPMESLIISDPVIVEEVTRQEDWNPIRLSLEPWKAYRDLRGVDYGLVTLDNEPWRKVRSVLSKRMMRPNEIVQYIGKVDDIAYEFIQRLIILMTANGRRGTVPDLNNEGGGGTVPDLNNEGGGGTVPDLNNEFYKWAMESVGIILFDVNLGCIKNPIPHEIQQFIDAIAKMFTNLAPLFALPMRFHTSLNTKPWRENVEAWDIIWNTAMKYINLKCESISKNVKNKELEQEVDLLTYLLASKKLSMSEICGSVVELLLGGVDTTSNTLLWAMYRLSRAPECQERLHTELVNVLNGAPVNKNNIQKLQYLKAVIRETLRLYPIIPNINRVPQKDINIAGYNIPKGTNILMLNYVMSRNDENYENANEFKPERWLRGNTENKVNIYASLPFGYGTRMCIGKRVAEMETQILLAKICQTFTLKPTHDEELVGTLRGLLIPEKDVPVKFVARNSTD